MEKKNNSNLQEIIEKNQILNWTCDECEQPFTEIDYNDKNFTLWFSIDNYQWEDLGDQAKLSLIIHSITHEKTSYFNCPNVESCEECRKKFSSDKMKVGIGEDDKDKYYCEQCFNAKYGEYLKERAKRKELTIEQKEVMRTIQKALTEHLNGKYHRGGHDFSKCEGSECEGYKQTLESYGIK